MGLYTNIPQDHCIISVRAALNTRSDQTVPTEFLVKLLKNVLMSNIFEFNNKLYLQIIGKALGSKGGPTISNIYMKSLDIFFGWNRQSVGQSKRKFIERIKNHLGYIDQNTKSIGKHFNTPGHSKSDMRCHVINKSHA